MTDVGRSAREQREYDRFHFPETDILRNKRNIRDPSLLAETEKLYVGFQLRKALPKEARTIETDGLKAIHHHLFHNLYSWAGEFRTYTTGRGAAPFAVPEFIKPTLDGLFRDLHAEKDLVGLDKPQFAARAAHYVNEINAVHPFIEGNGRTQRVWLRNLADQAGYSINLKGQDKDAWNEASRQGFHGQNGPMVALIHQAMEHRPDEKSKLHDTRDRIKENFSRQRNDGEPSHAAQKGRIDNNDKGGRSGR